MEPIDTTTDMGAHDDALHAELRSMIARSRTRLAAMVNSELTRLYWSVGERLRRGALGGERAAYGARIVARQGEKLAAEFGRGFEAKNLRRMIQFSEAFPDAQIVATLSRQLNWSQFVCLIPLPTQEARQFYAHAWQNPVHRSARRSPPLRAWFCT